MSRMRAFFTSGPRPIWLRYVLLIALASGLVRVALWNDWMRTSAVLYVAIPYLIGCLVYIYVPQPVGIRYGIRVWRHMRIALIIMLTTSLLLFEGFLCVLMFLPIYLVFALVGVALIPPSRRSVREAQGMDRDMGDIFRLSVIPAAILLLSLDGIRGIGPDRHVEVTRSAVLDMTPDEIRRTIIGHGYPDEGRSAWLKLFPRPVHVDSPSLEVGARHTAHMEYRRWGLPGFNVHRGTLVMEFTQNTDERLAARFVHDDSYLSHYMTFKTWEMRMEPQSDGRTQITLAVTYDRDVAPAWYFGPPMRKAVADGLDYALSDILAGDR